MNQGTQGYSLTKKTEGPKSRDTVSLNSGCFAIKIKGFQAFWKWQFTIIPYLNQSN
jgi:hypothetical protein